MRQAKWLGLAIAIWGLASSMGMASTPNPMYRPLPLELNRRVSDRLSPQDIPTGEGGFARDYIMTLQAGDQIRIALTSAAFDPIVSLLAADGSTVAENDDGPDGSRNAWLLLKVAEAGRYTVRVQSFRGTGVGSFQLEVTRLRLPSLPK